MTRVQPAAERERAENERNLKIAIGSFALFIAGRVVSAAYSNAPPAESSMWDPSVWATRGMLLGMFGILAELFMWIATPWRRRAAVWGGALVAWGSAVALARFAPAPSGALAQYGVSVQGIARTVEILAFCIVIFFPFGWLLVILDERRKKDLVQFPSRGARIPRKPAP
jgi:hypothetical protein